MWRVLVSSDFSSNASATPLAMLSQPATLKRQKRLRVSLCAYLIIPGGEFSHRLCEF